MKRLSWLMFVLAAVIIVSGCTSGKNEPVTEEGTPVNEQWLGEWAGDIEIPQSPLMIILEFAESKGTLSVPAQGLTNYPFETVEYEADKVSIDINLNGSAIKIEGALQDNEISGTFTQDGMSFPVVLKPYEEAPVTYEKLSIPVEGGELAVALEPAASGEASPIAIIIAGSGPTDKDGNTLGGGKNDSLKLIAEGLAERGIASIRFDKRAIGDNAGLVEKEEDLLFDQFVEDVKQIIAYAKSQDRFTSVHLIGHSEGSLVGMLAAQDSDVSSFISIAGAGRPADVLLLEQLQGQLSGELLEEAEGIIASLKAGETVDTVSADLQALFRASVQPYMISWLQHDPAELIGQLRQPVLIIQGTHDIQVPEDDAKLLSAGKPDAQLQIIAGMNHVLKDAPADREANIATYGDPSLPLSAGLVANIEAFISAHK